MVIVMWTHEELLEIRNRAELEASISHQNILWRYACLALASSASHLISLTERICQHEITAIDSYQHGFTPQQATEE